MMSIVLDRTQHPHPTEKPAKGQGRSHIISEERLIEEILKAAGLEPLD